MNRVLVDSTNGSVDVTLASVGLGAGMLLTLTQMGKESEVIFIRVKFGRPLALAILSL